jgi:hypothetical protein
LRVKTDDGNPGYIDFPFWGRFPVVVASYKIGEKSGEQGQCSVSLSFTRAGVTLAERHAAVPGTEKLFDGAKETLKAAAAEDFAEKLKDSADTNMLAAAFLNLKSGLLDIVGRVQAEKTRLAVLTGEAGGFADLINQGIRAPKELALALSSSVEAIAGSIISIGTAARETYSANGSASRAAYFTQGENSAKNALVLFLAASNYTVNTEAATAAAQNTKEAAENLYRTAAFAASTELLLSMAELPYQKTMNYWSLLQKLEASIDKNNPAVYAAAEDMRVAASRTLSSLELSSEMKRATDAPLPLLHLAHYLGCGASRLRQLNSIADSFAVKGEIVYV